MKLASHFSKNEILITVPNATRRVLEFLLKLRSSWTRPVAVSLEMWKGLYEQRWNIYKMLRNEYKDNFISFGPLTIRVCMLNDATLIRLDSSSVCMMIETTLRRMFEFDRCIDVTSERLARLVDTVNVKYMRFSNIQKRIQKYYTR